MKEKAKWILGLVVKRRHSANGILFVVSISNLALQACAVAQKGLNTPTSSPESSLPLLRAGSKKEEPGNEVAKTQATSCGSEVIRRAMIHYYARSTNCLYFQRKGPHSSNVLNQIFNPSFTRDVSYLEQFPRHFSHSLFLFNFPLHWNNLPMPKMKRIVGGLYLLYKYEDNCPDKVGVRMRTCIFQIFVHKLNQRNIFKCFFNNVYRTIYFWECYNIITDDNRSWVDKLYFSMNFQMWSTDIMRIRNNRKIKWCFF